MNSLPRKRRNAFVESDLKSLGFVSRGVRWPRFSKYEVKDFGRDQLCIAPAVGAQIEWYRPFDYGPEILMDYLELGRNLDKDCFATAWNEDDKKLITYLDIDNREIPVKILTEEQIQYKTARMLEFCTKYGLLGIWWERLKEDPRREKRSHLQGHYFDWETNEEPPIKRHVESARDFFMSGILPGSMELLKKAQSELNTPNNETSHELFPGLADTIRSLIKDPEYPIQALINLASADKNDIYAEDFWREYGERCSWIEDDAVDLYYFYKVWRNFLSSGASPNGFYPGSNETWGKFLARNIQTPPISLGLAFDRGWKIRYDYETLSTALRVLFLQNLISKEPITSCANCGAAFISKIPHAKYCSPSCQHAAAQKRYVKSQKAKQAAAKINASKPSGELSTKHRKNRKKRGKL